MLEGQERPARKLRITGKGRCNLTNNCPPEDVLKNVNRNARFLNSAVRAFPPEEVMAFFEGLGVPLKTERGNRVFPVSDKAGDVADALAGAARRSAKFLRLRAREIVTEKGAEINRALAERASLVAEIVCGLPNVLKGELP